MILLLSQGPFAFMEAQLPADSVHDGGVSKSHAVLESVVRSYMLSCIHPNLNAPAAASGRSGCCTAQALALPEPCTLLWLHAGPCCARVHAGGRQ